jgi:hypothetical protein
VILFWTSSREALRFDNPSRPLGGRQAAAGVTGDKIANSLFEIGLDFYLHVGQFLADPSPHEQIDNI